MSHYLDRKINFRDQVTDEFWTCECTTQNVHEKPTCTTCNKKRRYKCYMCKTYSEIYMKSNKVKKSVSQKEEYDYYFRCCGNRLYSTLEVPKMEIKCTCPSYKLTRTLSYICESEKLFPKDISKNARILLAKGVAISAICNIAFDEHRQKILDDEDKKRINELQTRSFEEKQKNTTKPLEKEQYLLIKLLTSNEIKINATNTCSICFTNISECKEPSKIPCDHMFCKDCLNQWFKDNDTCPICRKKVGSSDEKSSGGQAVSPKAKLSIENKTSGSKIIKTDFEILFDLNLLVIHSAIQLIFFGNVIFASIKKADELTNQTNPRAD